MYLVCQRHAVHHHAAASIQRPSKPYGDAPTCPSKTGPCMPTAYFMAINKCTVDACIRRVHWPDAVGMYLFASRVTGGSTS